MHNWQGGLICAACKRRKSAKLHATSLPTIAAPTAPRPFAWSASRALMLNVHAHLAPTCLLPDRGQRALCPWD